MRSARQLLGASGRGTAREPQPCARRSPGSICRASKSEFSTGDPFVRPVASRAERSGHAFLLPRRSDEMPTWFSDN